MNYDMYRPVKAHADKAASYISAGRATNRSFNNCFMWWGSDAVAITLYRRARKRPDTKMAQNLFKYLSRDTVEKVVEKYKHWDNLEELAEHMKKEQAA
tara:strand:- start:205 stop:498 length:294 start_codon:yes stop_codon:yes gene_type:complete